MRNWNYGDVLLFLQYHQFDSLATLLIGYDFDGQDVNHWNSNNLGWLLSIFLIHEFELLLAQLGVTDLNQQERLLKKLKEHKPKRTIQENSEKTISKKEDEIRNNDIVVIRF